MHHVTIENGVLLVDGVLARLGSVKVYLDGESIHCVEADEHTRRVRAYARDPATGKRALDRDWKPVFEWVSGDVRIELAPDWRIQDWRIQD